MQHENIFKITTVSLVLTGRDFNNTSLIKNSDNDKSYVLLHLKLVDIKKVLLTSFWS